jgi:pimeloyl-ACP methyl ester carboxylesterase
VKNYENMIDINDRIKLSYIKKGQGKKIIILHGNRDSKTNFDRLIDDLAEYYMVFAIDLRGHGKSDKPKSGYQFEEFVEDIKEFIEVLKIDECSIIGHSLGASIAIQLALADGGSKIKNLVLMGTSAKFVPFFRIDMIKKENIKNTDLSSENIQNIIKNALRPYFILERYKNIEPIVFSNWSNMLPVIHQALVMQLKHPDLTGVLKGIKQRTLVIAGSEDKVTPVDSCRKVYNLIPNAEIKIIEGCGHFMYLEEEKVVFKVIKDFL